MAVRNVEYIIKLRDRFSKGIDRVNAKAFRLNKRMEGLNRTTLSLRGAFVALGGAFVIRNVVETTAQVEGLNLAISFASGSAVEAKKNLQFLDDLTEKLGLDALATKKGFQTLAGSFVGTGVEAAEQRDIFEKVSTAVSALNLSAADSEGVFLALGQIMSKGKVVAEELRRQIGNRLPGAFGIAARAMGVTTAEMDRLMSQGLIPAREFLPKFADELQRTFVGALDKSTKSLRANLNRLTNAFLELKIAAGDEFVPSIAGLVKLLPLITKNIGLLIKITKIAILTFITFKLSVFLLSKGLQLYVIITKAVIIVTRLLTGGLKAARTAMIAFGIATKASPIGIIAAILATAAGAFLLFRDDVDEATGSLDKFGNKLDEISAKRGAFLFAESVRGFVDPITKIINTGSIQKLTEAAVNFNKGQLESLRLFFEEQEELLGRAIINAKTVLEKSVLEQDLDDILNSLRVVNKEFAKFAKGKAAIDGITTGGISVKQVGVTKIVSAAPKIFNINIEKLVETINNNVTNIKEGMNESKKIITEALLSALNDTQAIVR